MMSGTVNGVHDINNQDDPVVYDGGSAVAGAQPIAALNSGEQTKRKRGRPRKYHPASKSPPRSAGRSSGFSSPAAGVAPSPGAAGKKSRGRPRGSGRKHLVTPLGSAGIGFTPHIITVKAGEDVTSKIMSFPQNATQVVCILSANGALSNVALRQADSSGGTVTYEGLFEILSLSGSFLVSESGGQRSRTGGLSVLLAGPDGRVLGGCVTGLLIAASSVQVVIGSFIGEGPKHQQSEVHHRAES